MQCLNCGAEIKDNETCEYCGRTCSKEHTSPTPKESATELIEKQPNLSARESATEFIKKQFHLLTLPTRIALIFWFIYCIINIAQMKNIGILQYVIVCVFGFLLFGIIVQIISLSLKRKKIRPAHSSVNDSKKDEQIPFDKPYDEMEGHEFEYFCGDILGKSGFTEIEVTKGSGDQGIDIIAYKDDIKYGIQCKCYSQNIGNKAVQEAFAGKTFYGCHIAAVLTNQYFTKSAHELAQKNGVLLWDRDRLEQFINLHK